MGRSSQSKETLKLHGTYREDRHGKGQLSPSEPDCPVWLSDEAKAEWKRIVPTLVKLVGVHKIDRSLLATYCETWAEWRNAVEFLQNEPEWYESKVKGKKKKNGEEEDDSIIRRLHPMVQIRQTSRNDLVKIGNKLGLSPSARTGLDIAQPDKNESAKEKFLA